MKTMMTDLLVHTATKSTFENQKGTTMKNERYSSYEELPLMLSAKEASAVLGISLAKTYELTKSRGFPVIKVGKRVLIPRDKLIAWIDQASGNK